MTKPKFSRLISGCMSWGIWGKQFDENQMIRLMSQFVENGVTTFDHADIYGDYTTEKSFGKALYNSNVIRENIQLITKCGIQYIGNARPNVVKHYNYNKDYIIWSVENSLKNLQTDYLDALLLHRPSPLMHPHEIAKAVIQLKADGKIRHFGVSNFSASQVDLISAEIPVEINQIEYSLTHFEAHNNGILDQTIANKMVPMAWSPLGSVFKDVNERSKRIKTLLQSLTKKYNATEDQLLLAWILKHPSGIHPIIGTTNFERIINAVNTTALDIEIEDWFLLLAASQGHKVP